MASWRVSATQRSLLGCIWGQRKQVGIDEKAVRGYLDKVAEQL